MAVLAESTLRDHGSTRMFKTTSASETIMTIKLVGPMVSKLARQNFSPFKMLSLRGRTAEALERLESTQRRY
jgi:hypothetical protein